MIFTITLNPAVDKTIELKNFKIGELNRITKAREDIGGKGINVSRVIKSLNGESIALGFLGGNSGDFIRKELKSLKIEEHFIEIEEHTRTNIKIIDINTKKLTEVNESGKPIPISKLNEFKEKLPSLLSKGDVVILSGSVPSNIPSNIYYELTKICQTQGARVILDADGALLIEGLKAQPFLIKPNLKELSTIYSGDLNNHIEIAKYLKKILTSRLQHIFLTMGGAGAIYVNSESAIFIPPLKLDVKSTVGAGDALVGALAYAITHNFLIMDMIRLAVASASAAIMKEGTQPGDKHTIDILKEKIEIHKIIGV